MGAYDPVISFENVTYTYPGSDRPALNNLSLTVRPGEKVMIAGPAGAGKSTLCLCLNGLVPHFHRGKFRGRVLVNGVDTKQSTPGALAHVVGLLFQDPSSQLVCPTVEDEVAFGPENYGVPRSEIRRRVTQALRSVRLSGYEERKPQMLSGGQQQSCASAALIAMGPQVYVLDEPTSNLDPIGSYQVLNLLGGLSRSEGKTMIIVEHKMEELLPIADRLIVMNRGEMILDGRPREVIENVDAMEKMGIKPPQVTVLASKLRKSNPSLKLPLTLEEAEDIFSGISLRRGSAGKFDPPRSQPLGDPIIITKNLCHIYEGGNVAVKEISLRIHEGEFMAIVGQNGSGKTTLVKHFNGLLRPSKGSVTVDGKDACRAPISELSRTVGYCFQNPDHQLCCHTVKEELEFGPTNLGMSPDMIRKNVETIAEMIGLREILEKNPFSLSKGERQRVAVGSVLTMRPSVLIVDEPTTGQDYGMSREMMNLYKKLNEEGKTIIVITHDMNLAAEYAKRAIVLKDGEILLDGTTRDVFSQATLLESTYLRPPQITSLCQIMGLPTSLTVDELYDLLKGVQVG